MFISNSSSESSASKPLARTTASDLSQETSLYSYFFSLSYLFEDLRKLEY